MFETLFPSEILLKQQIYSAAPYEERCKTADTAGISHGCGQLFEAAAEQAESCEPEPGDTDCGSRKGNFFQTGVLQGARADDADGIQEGVRIQ